MKYNCESCKMEFGNVYELINHQNKFCINSGFDSLNGLVQKNFRKNNKIPQKILKNYGKYSLNNISGVNQMSALELEKDVEQIDRNRIKIDNIKKYKYNKKSPQQQSSRKIIQQKDISIYSSKISEKNVLNQSFVSPPTSYPIHSPFKIHTVLNKSNTSLENMKPEDKEIYAIAKLEQLKSIRKNYQQNGGKNQQFQLTTAKTIQFYNKMLKKAQQQKEKEWKGEKSRNILNISEVSKRCETPIQKLQKFQQIEVKNIQNRERTKFISEGIQTPMYKNQYVQPPIIMVQSQNKDSSMKVIEKMLELKSEENKQLLEILRQKTTSQQNKNNSQLTKFQKKEPTRINTSQTNKTNNKKTFNFQKNMKYASQAQQKMLLSLQREQLEQLRLMSQLPDDLQEIKLPSMIATSELRMQMQKQILKHCLQKIESNSQNIQYQNKQKINSLKFKNRWNKKQLVNEFSEELNENKSQEQQNFNIEQLKHNNESNHRINNLSNNNINMNNSFKKQQQIEFNQQYQ